MMTLCDFDHRQSPSVQVAMMFAARHPELCVGAVAVVRLLASLVVEGGSARAHHRSSPLVATFASQRHYSQSFLLG